MATELHAGDHVTWHSHGQTVHGTVVKKVTSSGELAGRHVEASADAPQYEVRSDKTGATAVHKPGALTKVRS